MDLFKFFAKQDNIAGLVINDSSLKLVSLEVGQAGKPKLKAVYHENLQPGDIVGGKIKNKAGFSASAQKLADRSGVKFAIVSLPANFVFTKIYNLPNNLEGGKLKNSIKLISDFQLPKKPEEVYFDWEKINTPENNEVLLASINKEIVNELIAVLDETGIKTIALEFHPLSIARLIKDDQAWLIIETDTSATSLYVLKNKTIRILSIIPNNPKNKLETEIEKIINYFEFDNQPIEKLAVIGELSKAALGKIKLKPEILPLPELIPDQAKLEENNNWLTAFGTAYRSLIPRKKDSLISLMAVGTEETYNQQKAVVFVDFLSKTTIAVSLFIAVVFIGSWLLMLSIQKNFNQQIENYNSQPGSMDTAALETKAKNFNSLINTTDQLVKTEPRWSLVFEELKIKTTSGITINNLSIPSLSQPIILLGTAKSRADLNILKKSLESSALFNNINLPLDNLGKKDNIPFSISLSLANSETLFLK